MGGFHYVDKVICGNGFSTAFINAKPPRNKINIIIAPNRAVVEGKEADYRLNGNRSGNVVKFFYKNSIDTDLDANILMFVADSFLLLKEKIALIQDKINWVLIDEAHSVEIQSSFRPNLVNFFEKVRGVIGKDPALTCVTATPNLYTKPTITIKNEVVNGFDITLTKDREKALSRIRELRKNNESVIVATNSKNIIYNLRDRNNEIEADFVVGETLKEQLSELIIIKQNSESNLKIISSRGFEGFDIYGTDYNVFFFENRASQGGFESFFLSNLYQALNRARGGVKYAEYCRLELSNRRKNKFKDIDAEVDEFIDRTDISVEQKQSKGKDNKFLKFKPFVEFRIDNEGKFSIHRNTPAIQLYKESFLYDNPFPAPEFRQFLEDRNITVSKVEESQNDVKAIKIRESERIKRLKLNESYILKSGMFGDEYSFKAPYYVETREDFLKTFDAYIRRKNFNGSYELTERENITKELISDEKKFKKLVSEVTKAYRVRSIEKYGERASRPYIKEFKAKSERTVLKIIEAFTRDTIYFPEKMVAYRDYNTLTEIGMDEIHLLASKYNIVVLEVDIKSCFSRIIYALNGLRLPDDFYGIDKMNKEAINKFLNDFFYRESSKTPKRVQKANSRNKFLNLGFNKGVVEFLLDKFFEAKHRGSLFNFLTRFEKEITEELKSLIPEGTHEGVVRRHDSIIIHNPNISMAFLNNLTFLNITDDWVGVSENHKLKIN